MKLGIMTFPNSDSYGATLQMYALYHTVQKLGVQPEIIHYHNSYMKALHHTAAMQGTGRAKRTLRLMAKKLMHCKQERRFRRFERQMALYPKRLISRHEDLLRLKDRYDGVICGSDQVWNPDITGGDMSYFLDFCGAHTKRIAYAPSFGIEEFSPAFKAGIRPHLQQFHALSVRETPGRKLVEELTEKTVPVVLDPTFLLPQQDWEQLEQPHAAGNGDYILYYRVRRSDSLTNFCLEKAREQGLKVVFIGGNPIKQLKNKQMEYAYDLSPGQLLYLIHHARYVVTNSFHGMAFSIHYKRDFFLELPSVANSRLQQLVEATGLQDRVIGPDCAAVDSPVDYDRVYQRIEPERERSLNYLKEAITK